MPSSSYAASNIRTDEEVAVSVLVVDEVRIRPLVAGDRAAYLEAFGSLSSRARQLRFFGPKKAMTDREVDHVFDTGHDHRQVLVAEHVATGAVLAVGRMAPDGPGRVAVAVVVGDAWQGRGLGRRVLAALVAAADVEGVETVVAETLVDNAPARAMLASARFRPCGSSGGVMSWVRPTSASGRSGRRPSGRP